jgi:tetratricopeptide (TPR) repeat protein
MYKPEEARPYLRKAHALLAAGEYVSSALILGKALEFDPRESLEQVDLIEALGGPDPFVERIGDLEQRAEQNDAPQLQFLLAYIYYQMDRPPQAKAAIETAARRLPSSPAVDILRSVIGG